MAKIIGNTTATPNPRPDWHQTDSVKADYIKNKPDIYTKSEINNKFVQKSDITNVYRFKGSVETEEDLPGGDATIEIGDVYNVSDSGMNYAWTGTEWDALGGSVSDESVKEDINEIKTELNKKANKEDIVSTYRFCGSIDTFDEELMTPATYEIVPKGEPTYNGEVVGTYDAEKRTVTIDSDKLEGWDGYEVVVPIEEIVVPKGYYSCESDISIAGMDGYWADGHYAYKKNNEEIVTTVSIGYYGYHEAGTIALGNLNKHSSVEVELSENPFYDSEYEVITTLDVGDVYNTLDTGMNYAWTGTAWDALGGFSEFYKVERFNPVVIFEGIESETSYKKIWGAGGLIDNTNGYTAINTLIDVIPNVQYRIVNFNGVLTFYGSEQFDLQTNTPTFENSTCLPTEYTFTVPNNRYKLGLSMLQPQSLNDIKLYRISPIDEETTETVYTKDDLTIGKNNFKDNEIKAFLPLYKKQIVNFGDSIFGMYKAPSDISTRIADLTGATVYNCGFSGSRLSQHSSAAHKPFSMYKLANAVASGDFSEQDTAIEKYASTLGQAYINNLATLKSIDFNKVDIVTIAYGTNDFAGGAPLDKDIYPKNNQFFAGALRNSIETLLNAYPNLKIFLCTPIFRYSYTSNKGSDDIIIADSWGINSSQKLTDFVEKTKEIGNDYHIPVIDNYYELGINLFNHKRYLIEGDGVHPTGEGLELIARHITHGLLIGGNSGYVSRIIKVETAMGDIETALDSIIEIQNALIGGDSV